MKFFRAAKTLLTWQEPVLFSARTRDRPGWMRRGLLAFGIFSVMMFGMYADRNWGGRGPARKLSVPAAFLVSAGIGLFLTALLDAPDLNRQITISDDNISSFGNAGHHMSMTTWPLRGLLLVRLIPPEELGRSFGVMELQTVKGLSRVGVPRKVAMRRIAEVLHGQHVPVVLPGWEPVADRPKTDRPGTETPAAPPAPAVMPTASARIQPLDELEAGRIMSPFTFRVSLALALGPLLVSVLLAVGLWGWTFYQLKIAHVPGSVTHLAAVFGGIGLIIVGFWYTARLANLVPSLFVRSVARSVIEMRPGALFNSRDPEAIYIDVVPRKNWGKAMLREFTDTGLLKVDDLSRSLLFEGDLERWVIPAASLVSVEVESYRGAGQAEGQEKVEWFYVVVIRANAGGEVWEAPVWKCHVELRPKDNRLREANAIALCDRIRALRPSLAGTGQGVRT